MAGPESKKILFDLITAFIIAAILIILLILTKSDLERRLTRIQAQRNELSSWNAALESLATLKQDGEKAEAQLAILKKIITSQETVNKEFSKTLQALAAKNTAKLQLDFAESSAGAENQPASPSLGGPAYTAFNLKMDASYNNLLNFLKTALTGKFPVSWQSLSASLNSSDSQYSALISGKVFHQ